MKLLYNIFDGMFKDFMKYKRFKEFHRIIDKIHEKKVPIKGKTGSLELAQLQRISDMEIFEDYYYYVFDGAVIALDRETGTERWRDTSFMGGLTGYDIDEAGNIYICGYLGPDYFAISKDGEVLGRVDMMDPDYMWPYEIKYLGGNQIEITYEADFYGNAGGAVTFDIPAK